MLNIIQEKDKIIQELINSNKNKNHDYNNLINKFERENEEFKDVTQKSIYLAENNIYNNFLHNINNYPKNYYQ